MAEPLELLEMQVKLLEGNQVILNHQLDMLEEIYGIARFWLWLTVAGFAIPAVIIVIGAIFKVSILALIIAWALH